MPQEFILDGGHTVAVTICDGALVCDADLPVTPKGGPRVWMQRRDDGVAGWTVFVHVDDGDAVCMVKTEDGDGTPCSIVTMPRDSADCVSSE